MERLDWFERVISHVCYKGVSVKVQELMDILSQAPKDAEVFFDPYGTDDKEEWIDSGNPNYSAQNSLLLIQKRAFISEPGQTTFVLRLE